MTNFNDIEITKEGIIKSKVSFGSSDDKNLVISTTETNVNQNDMIIRELNKLKKAV